MIKLGSDKNGWRRYYCTICGHVEWLGPGEELPAHYECPLCEAPRSAMLLVDDPRLSRHKVGFKELAPAVWQVSKSPLFRADFNHYSYLLAHPDGLILFDAPPLVNEETREKIEAIGKPRLLVVSHQDFVGFAGDWAEALDIPSWMGAGDLPISGNRFEPSERINGSHKLADDLEVIRVPGHSEGSLALYWQDSPAGDVLCCGDALTVWHHTDGRIQLAFFQNPPVGQEIEELAARPVSLLLSCGGYLTNASQKLQRLLTMEERCARPWRGDTGGLWLDSIA
jgi:glyoxylase-like metal-dependent hydrolase (beta-lactamase superfamily II)